MDKIVKERCSICGNYNKDEEGNYKDLNTRFKCCDECQKDGDAFTNMVFRFSSLNDPNVFPVLPEQFLSHSPLFTFHSKGSTPKGYILYDLLMNVLRNVITKKRKWFNRYDVWHIAPTDIEDEDVSAFIEFALKTDLIIELKPFSEKTIDRAWNKPPFGWHSHILSQTRYRLKVKRLYQDDFVNILFPPICDKQFEKGTSIARMKWVNFALAYEEKYNNPPNI